MAEHTEARTITVSEAAAALRIGRALAYRLAREGTLPCVRLGRRLLVPREALDQLLDGTTRQEVMRG